MSCLAGSYRLNAPPMTRTFIYDATAFLEPAAGSRQLNQAEVGALIPSERRKGGGVGRNKRSRRNAKIPRR